VQGDQAPGAVQQVGVRGRTSQLGLDRGGQASCRFGVHPTPPKVGAHLPVDGANDRDGVSVAANDLCACRDQRVVGGSGAEEGAVPGDNGQR